MKMNVEYVLEVVEKIRNISGDDEVAHSLEDALYLEILQHIADGGRNGKKLAEAALKAHDIDFARWCA